MRTLSEATSSEPVGSTRPMQSKISGSFVKGVLLATLVVGTLDALAGIAVFDLALGRMGIVQILQWIASGVFGKEAFEMGLTGAALGTLFHYVIAFGFSLGLFSVYRRFPVIRDYPVSSGLAYGGYIWVFMNFVLLPHSNTVLGPFEPGVALTSFIWHMLLVGVPATVIAKKTLG